MNGLIAYIVSIVVYIWGASFLWSFIPDKWFFQWWGFPLLLTTVIIGLVFAIVMANIIDD